MLPENERAASAGRRDDGPKDRKISGHKYTAPRAREQGVCRITFARVPAAAILDSRIEGKALLVLSVLCMHASHKTNLAEIGMETIAREARLLRKNVPRYLGQLESLGHIRRARVGGGTTSNAYEVIFPSGGVLTHEDGSVLTHEDTKGFGVSSPVSRGVLTDEAGVSSPVRTRQSLSTEREQILSSDDVEAAIGMFDLFASQAGLPIEDCTVATRKALLARLTEAGGLDGWKIALEKVAESSYLLGKKTLAPIGLAKLVSPKIFAGLMEDRYRDREQGGSLADAIARTRRKRQRVTIQGEWS